MYELEELKSPKVVGKVHDLPGEVSNWKLPDIDLLSMEQVGKVHELLL